MVFWVVLEAQIDRYRASCSLLPYLRSVVITSSSSNRIQSRTVIRTTAMVCKVDVLEGQCQRLSPFDEQPDWIDSSFQFYLRERIRRVEHD